MKRKLLVDSKVRWRVNVLPNINMFVGNGIGDAALEETK